MAVFTRRHRPGFPVFRVFLAIALAVSAGWGGPYVTETSGPRWNEVGGVRWNEVGGGPSWVDSAGVRWNEVGGVRWNEVGGLLLTDAHGVRWNEVGGVRWNEVGGIEFQEPTTGARVDLELLDVLAELPNTSAIGVIVSYDAPPTQADLDDLVALGVTGGATFRALPMVAVSATRDQIVQIAALPAVRSVFSDTTTSFFDDHAAGQIGLDELADDDALGGPGGGPLTGSGVTIAVVDTGVDAGHPDLPLGTKVVENVALAGAIPAGIGFSDPTYVEGQTNTDPVLGHGTLVASIAAGSGVGSGGIYAGVAPGASVLSLSAGELNVMHVLEAFDYILDRQATFGVDVVNCSWGLEGWFDPDDPINIATRALYDAGIVVVFAAGNYGPAPDTMNRYAVAPWVVAVGSTAPDGSLSTFSSRGVHEELLYHPTLIAPGEAIVGARASGVSSVGAIAGLVGVGGAPPPPHDQLYTISSGTSFAAPHVSGVVALMLEAVPALTPDDVNRLLQQTATPWLVEPRAAVGAGRLDAWAAVAGALDPSRPFGSFVPALLDERPFAIVHQPPVETTRTLPAGSTLTIPVILHPDATSWQLSASWGTVPGVADIDVRVLAPGGGELARSETLNGLGLFGRTDGVHLVGELPDSFDVELSFKDGTGLQAQDVTLRQESAVPVVTGYDDLAGLNATDRGVITRAVSAGLIVGRGQSFEPFRPITRAELARSLALAAGAPQRVPDRRSFSDVRPGEPDFPFVESVAGARSQAWLEPFGLRRFAPRQTVRRLDAAQALVRAAGLGDEATARAGEPLPVADDASIPDDVKGFVAVAVDSGLLDWVDDGGGNDLFAPSVRLGRLEAAGSLLALQTVVAGEGSARASEPGSSPGGTRDRLSRAGGLERARRGAYRLGRR